MKRKSEARGSIVLKKQGNRKYYYYSRSRRVKIDPNASGKTKGSGKSKVVTEQIYLGTAEDVLEKLSRLTYDPQPVELESKEFGLPMALFAMAERVGLRDIINDVVPGKVKGISVGDFILLSAINRVGNQTPKEHMGKWYKKTDLRRLQGINGRKLNSKNFWLAFEKIVSERKIKRNKKERGLGSNDKVDIDELEKVLDDEKIKAIEMGLWENLIKRFGMILDVVVYDTTNFYTFHQSSTPNMLAQYGKSKEGQDHRRQVGLQLAIVKDLGIPVFHNVYAGHQNDVSLFPSAIRTLLNRYMEFTQSTEGFVIIFDKGNNSKKNIEQLDSREVKIDFVGSLTPSHHKDLVKISVDKFTEKIGHHRVYRTSKKVFGVERTIVITYHEPTYRRRVKAFEAQMKKVMVETKRYFETIADGPTDEVRAKIETFLKVKKIGTAQALRYYNFEVTHNGWVNRLSLRRKRSEVSFKKACFGKKILFTSMRNASSYEIIDYYKSGAQVEDAFHHVKDRDLVSYYPAYHWTDSKIRVHAFVCVIALLLLKLLSYEAREAGLEMSTKILVDELKDIRIVILAYPKRKVTRKVTKMSPIQQRLFDLFELQRFT